jgi:hypothetical protein
MLIISSENTGPTEAQLCRNDVYKVFYKQYSFAVKT